MQVFRIIKKIIFFPVRKSRQLQNAFDEIYRSCIRWLDGALGQKLRYKYYKKRLKYLGKSVIIDTGVFIDGAEFISIGENTHIDKNCILVAAPADLDLSYRYLKKRANPDFTGGRGSITIGKECHISQNAMIYGYGGVQIGDFCVMSADSKIYSLTSMAYNPCDKSEIVSIVPYSGKSPTLEGAVVMGDNAWIGIGVVVSPGVTLGKNSFVKSYSLVNGSFDENTYAGGIPAVEIRKRFDV